MTYKLVFHQSVKEFEAFLLQKAEQDKKTKGKGNWLNLAKQYIVQKERLKLYPYPEDFNSSALGDESPPIVKHIFRHTTITNLYRWGLDGGVTGNHRILFVLHNYYKVVLVHYFDKQYNGDIKALDILPAEERYFEHCENDPSLYPIMKGE